MTWLLLCKDTTTKKVVVKKEYKEEVEAIIEAISLVVENPRLECTYQEKH